MDKNRYVTKLGRGRWAVMIKDTSGNWRCATELPTREMARAYLRDSLALER